MPNGTIIVHEFVLDNDKVNPLYPALFALNMLITTPQGNSYTKEQIQEWLEDVGYENITFHKTNGPSTFIIGKKHG